MAFEKIIVLDDEMVIRKTLQDQLRKRRYSVATVGTISDAHELLQKDAFDLIFIDVQLPDGDGRELLETLSASESAPTAVMMTGNGDISTAVDCMKKGAFDYIIKPFDIEQIEVVIKKAELFNQLVRVNQYFSQDRQDSKLLIGDSPEMTQLRDMVKKVAATEATVLIQGENGTGKELIAQELYNFSSRSDKPFIKVNCAAMSETLMESEFFGHEKGAFTGATQRREGRFELANSGTILLDEISEISLHLQAKLLRVLQEKEFERVGGNKTLKVDVRVIATTNRDLLKFVEEGKFREDLYYRLNVFPLQVPPLRDRGSDILLLANDFLSRFARKHGKKSMKLSKTAKSALTGHSWPGNVRELQNTIERAVILTDDGACVEPTALGLISAPQEVPEAEEESGMASLASLHDMEKEYILKALEQADGKRTQAAEMLDISLRTLRTKLNQYKEEGAKFKAS